MASVVFILGAGASHGAGAPLMGNFLAVARNLNDTGKTGKYKADFDHVFEAIGKLQRVHSKSELDLSNIESIFNTLEMAKIINKFPDGDKEYIDKTITSLRRLIAVTLEESIRWEIASALDNTHKPRPPSVYRDFAELVKYLLEEARPKQDVAILTFNYDCALDYALDYHGINANYCLDNTSTNDIPLLKLHGSVNWSRCTECKKIIPCSIEDYIQSSRLGRATISFLYYFSQWQHCKNKNISTEPFIIPPTWNKTDAHTEISEVWQKAAQELSEAEHIFISGYSMPETDVFFRLLFALGTEGIRPLRNISVFDTNPKVEEKFKSMLGVGTKEVFSYQMHSFNQMSSVLKERYFQPK